MFKSASACWTQLDSTRTSLMTRLERYAALTIPKLNLPNGFNVESTDQTHDYQSIGAQAVNHLTNKIMLALFAPSRPFFRVSTGKNTQADMAAAGVPPEDVANILAKFERDAVAELDGRGQRPKLYTLIKHLIVNGNVLMVLEDEAIRVMSVKYWCVKRDHAGEVHTLIIKERIKFDELDQKVQEELVGLYNADTEVDHYKYFLRDAKGDYTMTQWCNEKQLSTQFNGKWPSDVFPYRVLTWDLADDSNYATGLIEEYCGDFEACSILSENVVDGAVLGAEMRWLANPTGQTSVEELNRSKNGDFLSGREGDIAAIQGGNHAAIQMADVVLQRYERRISLGFLMQTGVTRNAERVTAEEIRITANELETAFGGVYSTLANNIQAPVAYWLLKAIGANLAGTDLRVAVVTGLDALSRNGDLENLRLAFQDLAQLMAVPPMLQARIKWNPLAKFVGNGRGVDLIPFLMSDEEWQELQQQQAQQRVAESSATATGEATAEGYGAAAQQGNQQ